MKDPKEHKTDTQKKTQHIVQLALTYGSIAGIIIIIYFLLVHAFFELDTVSARIWARYLKFIPLFILVYLGIKKYKFGYKETFKTERVYLAGNAIALVAGLWVVVASIIGYFIDPEFALEPFYFAEGYYRHILSWLLSISEILAVGGLIFTHASVMLYQRSPTEEFNEGEEN